LSSGAIPQSEQEDAFYNKTTDLGERSQNVVPNCKAVLEVNWDLEDTPECAGAIAALNAKASSQGCHRFFDNPIDIRRTLIAKRQEAGHDTPYGHTCSNLIEQIDGMSKYERPAWALDVRQTLPWLMNKQIERLARLSAAR
jgi:hypothetical protein